MGLHDEFIRAFFPQGAPSISAFFAEMDGKQCHCFLAGSIEHFFRLCTAIGVIRDGFFSLPPSHLQNPLAVATRFPEIID
jgi:hypothetical protein